MESFEVARELIKRWGAEALIISEERAEAHRRADQKDGFELWRGVAEAVRMILTGHSRVAASGS